MKKMALVIAVLGFAVCGADAAKACSSYPYTLTNGAAADADQVNANFASILNCANNLLPATSPVIGGQALFNGIPGQGVIEFRDTTWPADTFSMKIGQYNGGTTIFQTLNTTAWELEAGLTPAIFVSTSANVGIKTTSPSYTLHVNGSVAGTSAYNNLSDIRLKKNIVTISDALSIIEKLNGVRFQWRSENERTVGKSLDLAVEKPQVGFVAQEVVKTLPEAVTTSQDGLMSMQESKVVPVLVEAVKQLAATNKAQSDEIAKLKLRMSMFERQTGTFRATSRTLATR